MAPAFFLKALVLEGAGPVLDGCASCGEPDGAVELVAFDLAEGGALCRRCRRGRPVSPEALDLLRRIAGRGAGRRAGAARRRPCTDEVAALATEAMEVAPRPPAALGAVGGRSTEPGAPSGGRRPRRSASTSTCRSAGSRCDYCAFATYTDRDHLMARYVDACVAELAPGGRDGELPAATSVFFGGGTPSRLPAELLAAILGAVPPARRAPR